MLALPSSTFQSELQRLYHLLLHFKSAFATWLHSRWRSLRLPRRRFWNSPALAAALDTLKQVTADLNRVASVMVTATRILAGANELIGHGRAAVDAVKSVSAA